MNETGPVQETDPVHQVELSAGTLEYSDTAGAGPVVVLIPGLAMNGSVWRRVVRELPWSYRVLVPVLPLGGHRRPMRPDADLSPRGIGLLVAEFLEALDLRDVTLVGNDSGLFLFTAAERPERVGRLVITSCEAFENFPPGLPGRTLRLAATLPGGVTLLAQGLRLRPLRRLPMAYGWMSRRPVPAEITDAWLAPLLGQREIRRDLTRYLRSAKKGDLLDVAEGLGRFDRPVLVVWAAEDRVMPPAHGQRLVDLLPDARLTTIADSYTLLPEDQPAELAGAIQAFVQEHVRPGRPGRAGGHGGIGLPAAPAHGVDEPVALDGCRPGDAASAEQPPAGTALPQARSRATTRRHTDESHPG